MQLALWSLVVLPSLLPLTSVAQEEPAPASDLELAARELARLGYEIDLDRLAVETANGKKLRTDLIEQQSLLMAPGQLEATCELVNALGTYEVESPEELLEEFAKAFGKTALAYYHPGRKALVILDDSGNPMSTLVPSAFILAHELVHAWRDQCSDLAALMRAGDPTLDDFFVRQCILEGEAQLPATAIELLKNGGSLEELTLDDLESPLDELLSGPLAMPYTHGSRLALLRWQAGGWDAVRSAWEHRPASSEQILHIDKLGLDEPRAVDLPGWPLTDVEAEFVRETCVGEGTIYRLLRGKGNASEEARVAAAGWDGDRLILYRTDVGEAAFIWRSVWDRELDAAQFAELLGDCGDGLVAVRGRVVDWVRSVDGTLAPRLLEALAGDGFEPEAVAADIASTEAVEASWAAESGDDPFLAEGRWIHPAQGFSLPAPEAWSERTIGGNSMLIRPGSPKPSGSLFVVSFPNVGGKSLEELVELNRTQLETMGFEVQALDVRELGGRSMLWARSQGELQGQEFRATSALFLHGTKQVLITCSMAVAEGLDDVRIDELFAELRFDARDYARPAGNAPPPRTPDAPPEVLQETWTVIDSTTRLPAPGVDVWVMLDDHYDFDLDPARDQTEIEVLARRRGRRFRTDKAGSTMITVRDRKRYWIGARSGELFGFNELKGYGEGDPHLWLAPDRSLEVRVVDAEGEPVQDVPVGLLFLSEYFGSMGATVNTRGLRGRAEFKNVLNHLHPWQEGSSAFLTFAFPVNDAPLIRIRAEDSFETPYRLVLPPTGSILVRYECEVPGAVVPSEPHHHSGIARLVANYDGQSHHFSPEKGGWRGSNSKGWTFSRVGLDMTLGLNVGFEDVVERLRGPVEAGEQVVETLPCE